ncbi:MAG TPA: hypothetical protein VLA36_11295 [Longimicrobiales bacterium]|nr:hypothetical protein [Longimicrobiales bacterium]
MKSPRTSLALAVAGVLVACEAPVTAPEPEVPLAPSLSIQSTAGFATAGGLTLLASGGDLQSFVDNANAALAARGAAVMIHHAEWIDGSGDTDAAKIVFANNRTLRLTSRWVPGDPRRGAAGPDLTQGSFPFFQVANGTIATEAIIDGTFDTWNGVGCSNLTVNKVAIPAAVFPSAILSLGGFANDAFAADISTIGWLPGPIFDAILGSGASANVLGVTFTFVWLAAPGVPSDIDNDHNNDTALKEVWYNDAFTWTDAGGGPFDPDVDIETVALHENGHTLELGHFGKLTARFAKKGLRIQASPRAVMNATYIGSLRSPLRTDRAALCGFYGSWN